MLKARFSIPLLFKQLNPIEILFVLLAIIHLLFLVKAQSPLENIYILSFFYVTTGWFYFHSLPRVSLTKKILPRLIGLFVIAYFSIKTLSIFQNELRLFWFIIPPIFFLGFALIANGWAGIKDFWRSLVGIIVLSWLTPLMLSLAARFAFLQKFSAQLSTYFLWYLGFQSQSRDAYIFVNDGAVSIALGCTAIPIFTVFLSMLLILALYFPRLIQNLPLATAIALVIGFVLSIIRIMIMAVVVNDKPVFDYWHGTTGSNIFASVGLLLFGGYLFWQIPSSPAISRTSKVITSPKITETQSFPITITSRLGRKLAYHSEP